MRFLFGSLTMARNLQKRPKSLPNPLTPIGSCRDLFSLLSFRETCAPLARNHAFLQKHLNPHAWIREQLSKSAHLPDPTHAGTKYPRSGEPLTPTTGGRGHGDQDPQHMRACPSIHSTAQGHGDQHQEQQWQGPEGGCNFPRHARVRITTGARDGGPQKSSPKALGAEMRSWVCRRCVAGVPSGV